MRPCQQKIAMALSRGLHTNTHTYTARPVLRPYRCFHLSPAASMPRRRNFFTSNVYLSQGGEAPGSKSDDSETNHRTPQPQSKRKAVRSSGAKNSLRRVAIIAQRPPRQKQRPAIDGARAIAEGFDADESSMVISATCVAEAFDMASVLDILRAHGFSIDPDSTGFEPSEVVHARGVNGGDIFVFPSGSIVAWSLPPDVVTKQLLNAAEVPLRPELREVEDLEYTTDPTRDTSGMKGDVVVLGTAPGEDGQQQQQPHDGSNGVPSDRGGIDTTLAKIAFSSGLARSAKLAVLESALTAYFESTRSIPDMLSRGRSSTWMSPASPQLGRKFILQKTGELLSLRARLNHYSELTDSLPDIFWDSRSELGLEGYYEQVGRALDVNVRIRTLNQKMDYAQEIATVLREMSSEQHNTRLEVIIIVLIAVEVIFELRRIVIEWTAEREEKEAAAAAAADGTIAN